VLDIDHFYWFLAVLLVDAYILSNTVCMNSVGLGRSKMAFIEMSGKTIVYCQKGDVFTGYKTELHGSYGLLKVTQLHVFTGLYLSTHIA